ncbi:bacteriophage HK97-gp10 putative tail-component [Lachnotalea glycerini]|uniref:Bacteriophage HK97-gp10 putative tail-component n=1 Tax=Lachnotalea glycerini TaxID=1763509 RepID=A0A318ER23_9FIRM|nr:HK97 gp10 family phage protein [Lachnotalea glycerini]PXV85094.1 bacteriophage HK97-gp10 putative tail-component [Lachnotalea glycerini]
MADWGSCDFTELKKFRDKIESLSEGRVDEFCTVVAKELAARLIAKVIKRTPVRKSEDCPAGVKGGTLRRGWTTQKSGGGSEGLKTNGASEYVNTLKVHHYGGYYVVEITNPVEYASYVEYGHRKRGGKGWVNGRFMMTMSEKELERQAPAVIQKKLMSYLKGVFN